MKAARFPAHRDLAGLDFATSAVDEALVRSLHRTAFTEAAHNVVFIGGRGTGKSHLATALLVLPMPALERILRRVTELANGQGDSFTQLDIEPHGSEPIFV